MASGGGRILGSGPIDTDVAGGAGRDGADGDRDNRLVGEQNGVAVGEPEFVAVGPTALDELHGADQCDDFLFGVAFHNINIIIAPIAANGTAQIFHKAHPKFCTIYPTARPTKAPARY